MAFLQTIRSLFSPAAARREPVVEVLAPAPPDTAYGLARLHGGNIKELVILNQRCFTNGDSYSRQTFNYLLDEPRTLGYQVRTESGEMAAFAFVMTDLDSGSAHLTTIGVAPEHRRRGLATKLLKHVERMLQAKGIGTLMLEVRVGNRGAQELYERAGYSIVQRIEKYYGNGEDGYLMIKSLV
ncbi:MAG: ribosomal protein S18-alanine N-acetyltransferase [Pyrinomonadaceae bacterium]